MALGFTIADDCCHLGGVSIRLGRPGKGITAWGISGIDRAKAIDGLDTRTCPPPQGNHETRHPNGAMGLDHVVVISPDFARTASALEAAGMPLKRTTTDNGPLQGFRRLGPTILELVEVPDARATRFWGLTITVSDLDALAERLHDNLGRIKDAVQPGRRIATLKPSAGLTEPVAFMTPDTLDESSSSVP